jgi:hypothetical protein
MINLIIGWDDDMCCFSVLRNYTIVTTNEHAIDSITLLGTDLLEDLRWSEAR